VCGKASKPLHNNCNKFKRIILIFWQVKSKSDTKLLGYYIQWKSTSPAQCCYYTLYNITLYCAWGRIVGLYACHRSIGTFWVGPIKSVINTQYWWAWIFQLTLLQPTYWLTREWSPERVAFILAAWNRYLGHVPRSPCSLSVNQRHLPHTSHTSRCPWLPVITIT